MDRGLSEKGHSMIDLRAIGEAAKYLPPLPEGDDWTLRWNERNRLVRSVLGDTVEPGMVHSFQWKDFILPGACALTFRVHGENDFLYMTLGLTQPLRAGNSAYPWEFAVRAAGLYAWPIDLLYQLVTHWLAAPGEVWFGYQLPLKFYIGDDGGISASISERLHHQNTVGAIRKLYLWLDGSEIKFGASEEEFGLLTVVPVTDDEVQLADATTPAHLMLLLRRSGISQICDPHRQSVLSHRHFSNVWPGIARLSHDEVLEKLRLAGE